VRASALAYTSLLSLVPLFAIMFAVLKGLGVQSRLEPLLLSRLSLDQETTDQIIAYIDKVNVGTLGSIGAAALVLTVISVLGTIEASFNYIWRVAQQRTLWRKVSDYLGVVMITPFLLLAAGALTSAAQVQQVIEFVTTNGLLGGVAVRILALTPIVMNVVALGVLYLVMPNRRGDWRALLPGALFAGTAWYLVQTLYVQLQVGVANYNAIYGAMAQLPVTLAWLYVSWAIVLAGAELAAVLEYGGEAVAAGARTVDRRAVALELLVRAARAFAGDGEAPTAVRVARELHLDVALVLEVAADLRTRGWLAADEDHPGRLVLARAPAALDLGELAELSTPGWIPARADAAVTNALGEVAASAQRTLAAVALDGLRTEAQPAGEAK
ncbi:MAG: YihY/virulence factor BrkB family protein, partial [Deltaproteobacteria bacterium]|nr:YihY/virulence factor BrkB family protein [Deltaproteobacteria bacterium]